MAVFLQEQIINPTDSDSLVKRLREDKKALSEEVYQEGFNFGLKSVNYLSYQDFHRIQSINIEWLHFDSEVFTQLWSFLDSHHYQAQNRLDGGELSHLLPDEDQNKVTFVKGWIAGILSVWQKIKDQVDPEDER